MQFDNPWLGWCSMPSDYGSNNALSVVRVTHWPGDNLWPETPNKDFTEQHAKRSSFSHSSLDGRRISYTYRFYDPYSAYVNESLPPGQPPEGRRIDNVHWVPAIGVLDRMIMDLESIAKECSIICWDSAIQCFPYVAQHLKRLFRLTILSFGDDLPGSSEIKTFPVAPFFDVLTHAMYTWDFPSGKTVPQVYAEHGLKDCRFIAWGPLQVYDDTWFDQKIKELKDNKLSLDLIWLGGSGIAGHRRQSLQNILHADHSNLRMKFYGNQMRDGWYAGAASEIYAQSIFGLNIPESSFFNGRFADLFMSGNIQFIHDPCRELSHFGFVDGKHFLSYDGTGEDLIQKVKTFKDDKKTLTTIAIAARTKFLEFRAKYDAAEVEVGILNDYVKQITEGRS